MRQPVVSCRFKEIQVVEEEATVQISNATPVMFSMESERSEPAAIVGNNASMEGASLGAAERQLPHKRHLLSTFLREGLLPRPHAVHVRLCWSAPLSLLMWLVQATQTLSSLLARLQAT